MLFGKYKRLWFLWVDSWCFHFGFWNDSWTFWGTFVALFAQSRHKAVQKWHASWLVVLRHLKFPCYVISIKWCVKRLPSFRKHNVKSVVIIIKLQVLPDQFIDDHIFFVKFWLSYLGIIQCWKNLWSHFGFHFVHYSSIFKSFPQCVLKFFKRGHFKIFTNYFKFTYMLFNY